MEKDDRLKDTKSALGGQRCLCRTCGERFNSLSAFDRHRIGAFDDRRCLTPGEMRARRMMLNTRGFWITSPMTVHQPAAGIAFWPMARRPKP